MTTPYLSDRDVAEMFDISWQQVQARCLAKQWPHLKVGRAYRFKAEHVKAIEAMHEVLPAEPQQQSETWGRKTRSPNA